MSPISYEIRTSDPLNLVPRNVRRHESNLCCCWRCRENIQRLRSFAHNSARAPAKTQTNVTL